MLRDGEHANKDFHKYSGQKPLAHMLPSHARVPMVVPGLRWGNGQGNEGGVAEKGPKDGYIIFIQCHRLMLFIY